MDVCIGLAIIGLGGLLAFGLGGISFGAGYDRIGPRFFPYVVAFGLLVLGGWFLLAGLLRVETLRAESPRHAGSAPIADWAPIGYLSAALIMTLLLMERAGFVVACAIQFWLVARAFGSRRSVRDAIVAGGLSLVCFVAFSSGLGLTLPSGILEGIL